MSKGHFINVEYELKNLTHGLKRGKDYILEMFNSLFCRLN